LQIFVAYMLADEIYTCQVICQLVLLSISFIRNIVW